jgi:hypothetical protein
MKGVFTVLIFRLAAVLAGKNARKENNNATNNNTSNTLHPAAFALR